jgi:hypothetical protein
MAVLIHSSMARKHSQPLRRRKARSHDQRRWNESMKLAAKAWDRLTDEQRLAWHSAGKSRRTSGRSYFIRINLSRFYNGEEILVRPPPSEVPYGKRVLQWLLITQHRGGLSIKLEVTPVPGARFTVWASRPCNPGRSACPKCPRLGPLPPPIDGWSDIAPLYLQKHGAYIRTQRLELAGKRIFVRLRQELDEGPSLFQSINACVSDPQAGPRPLKKP